MSVVINYVSKYISIIATNTRATLDENAELGYKDGAENLENLPNMGWTAGSGYTPFLDKFKERLRDEDINNPNRVCELFDEIDREDTKAEPQHANDIKESIASISWLGRVDGEYRMRVGLLSSQFKESEKSNLAILLDDKFSIFYPSHFLQNPQLIEAFEKKIGLEFAYNPADNESFTELIRKIVLMFHVISENSNEADSAWEIGVHRFTSEGSAKQKITVTVDRNQSDVNFNFTTTEISLTPFN